MDTLHLYIYGILCVYIYTFIYLSISSCHQQYNKGVSFNIGELNQEYGNANPKDMEKSVSAIEVGGTMRKSSNAPFGLNQWTDLKEEFDRKPMGFYL